MNAIEATRQLGAAIQQDERFISYAKAKLASDGNEELQQSIGEFNMIRMQLDQLLEDESRDEGKVSELNEKLRGVYSGIMSEAHMVEYNTAKAALDGLLSEINTIIMKSVAGEDPAVCETHEGSCGGGCSSCSGCH